MTSIAPSPFQSRRLPSGLLKIAIVDPDDAARGRLKALLSEVVFPRASVMLECRTVAAFEQARPWMPLDAVFADITLPDGGRLAWSRPSPIHPEVVFVSANREHASVAFDLEAADFLTKPCSEGRLLQTMRRLWRYRRASGLQPAADVLTDRQVQILELAAEGQSNKDIARALGLSPFTVRNHMSVLFRAFGVSHRAALAAVADAHRIKQTDLDLEPAAGPARPGLRMATGKPRFSSGSSPAQVSAATATISVQ